MLQKFIVGLFSVIGLLSAYAAFQPSEFKISRELVINASPSELFPWINDTSKSNQWMPWSEIDPQVKFTTQGPVEGVGAMSTWESPGQMGTGQAVVVESVLNQSVKTKLNYTKPMEMEQLAEIVLTEVDGGTKVTWNVTGNNNFFGRFMCIFFNMDEMVGSNFLKGLNKLQSLTQAATP